MARYKDCLLNERKWILSKTRVQSFVNKGTITSLVIRVQWSQSFVMSLHFQYKDGCGPRNQGILPVAIWSVAYSLPRRCSLIAWRTQKVSASEAIRSAVSISIRLFRKMFSEYEAKILRVLVSKIKRSPRCIGTGKLKPQPSCLSFIHILSRCEVALFVSHASRAARSFVTE